MITVSVVSHGHGAMVADLVAQMLALPEVSRVIVTLNIEEPLTLAADARIKVVRNTVPQGFGANHNAAFALCETGFYCVVNPDVELLENPFPTLLKALALPAAGLAAPLVVGQGGAVEDSWRRFPSPFDLLRKALFGDKGVYAAAERSEPFFPDWAAGMFLLFETQAYAELTGFDEAFFLYYEDVDICVRLQAADRRVVGVAAARIVHKAQRSSWHSWRYRRYHLASMLRYFSRDWRRVFPSLLRSNGR